MEWKQRKMSHDDIFERLSQHMDQRDKQAKEKYAIMVRSLKKKFEKLEELTTKQNTQSAVNPNPYAPPFYPFLSSFASPSQPSIQPPSYSVYPFLIITPPNTAAGNSIQHDTSCRGAIPKRPTVTFVDDKQNKSNKTVEWTEEVGKGARSSRKKIDSLNWAYNRESDRSHSSNLSNRAFNTNVFRMPKIDIDF